MQMRATHDLHARIAPVNEAESLVETRVSFHYCPLSEHLFIIYI